MPGADETGELADSGLAADILREAGGTPEAARSDRGSARNRARPARPAPVDGTDENDEQLDPEPNAARNAPAAGEDDNADPANEDLNQDTDADPNADPANGDPNAEPGSDPNNDPAAADDPNADPAAGVDPKDDTPEWAKRRFSEYAQQVKDLRRELVEARAQGGNGANGAARPAPADVEVLQAETPAQIAQLREAAERIEEWAELNREGVEADPDKPNSRGYTPQEIAQARISARKKLRAIDAREKELEHVQRYNQAAHQIHPGFNDPDSDESRALAYVLQIVPELRRLQNYRTIIGDAVAHDRNRQKQARETAAVRKGPNGQPLPGRPVPGNNRPPPPRTGGAPARGPANAGPANVANRQKARERAFRHGSEADIANFVEASLGR